MAKKIVIYNFQTAKQDWFTDLKNLYIKKIKPFLAIEIITLKTINVDRDDWQKKINFEQNEFLQKIEDSDFFILLDQNGKNFNSESFAQSIENQINYGKKRIVFLIGGAYGVTETIKKKADLKIKLSDFVLNHLIAESLLLEQIYRSLTIINRIPYHNN